MGDPDFEEQLLQEKLETSNKELSDDRTYKDKDGTEYEWDPHKNAWFPKIDDNFIAQYQMNYGIDSASSSENKDGIEDQNGQKSDQKEKEFEKSCREYYDYYYGQGDNSEDSEYTFEDYLAYCKYNQGDGSSEQGENEDEDEKDEERKNGKKDDAKPGEKRKPNREEGWFEHDNENTAHIYVSGLPLDITDEEYLELMVKYGLIMYDPQTRKPKLKLYKDEDGEPKGDGLCCYIKQESVELALKLLSGLDVRGHTVSVERAQFEMKGQYDPQKKRKKMSNKAKRKMKENQAKLFDWRLDKVEEGRPKNEKTVVLKNMFDPQEFEEDPVLINELSEDVRLEAAKFGEVKKVEVYDRHADGVMTVRFKEAEEADKCIEQLHGRWFAKRRIIAQVWDGKTKYDVQETEEEKTARLKKWANFLEKGAKESSDTSSEAVVAPDAVVPDAPDAVVPDAVVVLDAVVASSDSVTTPSDPTVMSSKCVATPSDSVAVSSDSIVMSTDDVETPPDSIVMSPDDVEMSADPNVTSSYSAATISDPKVTSSESATSTSDHVVTLQTSTHISSDNNVKQ